MRKPIDGDIKETGLIGRSFDGDGGSACISGDTIGFGVVGDV